MKRFDIYYQGVHQTQWVAKSGPHAAAEFAQRMKLPPGSRLEIREIGTGAIEQFEHVVGDNPDTAGVEKSWWRRIIGR